MSPDVSRPVNSHRDVTESDVDVQIATNKRSDKLLSDLRLVQELKVHKGVVWVMRFSPDNQMLATGGEDSNIYVWRVVEQRSNLIVA